MKLATEEQMEFNISIGEHPHRTYSRLYWTRIMMPTQEEMKHMNGSRVEKLPKRQVSLKHLWHMGMVVGISKQNMKKEWIDG